MFVCIGDENMDGLINNTLTSITLPKLSRSYVSFHHICGNNLTPDGSNSLNCSMIFGLFNEHSEQQTMDDTLYYFHEIPSHKMYNNGSLKLMSDMFYENLELPMVRQGDRLRLLASFDSKYGGIGLDNVKFTTPQKYKIFTYFFISKIVALTFFLYTVFKHCNDFGHLFRCVPGWTRHIGYKLREDAETKNLKVSTLKGSGLLQSDIDKKTYQSKAFTVDSVEQCAR